MNIFIIGPSRSAKTPIANLVAERFGFARISVSDWVRSIFPSSPWCTNTNPVSMEDKQKCLEEITEFSQTLLHEDPNRCINFIKDKYPGYKLSSRSFSDTYILEGFRNPRDFLNFYNPKYDKVVFLTYPSSPLQPSAFETEGISIIEQSVDWFIKCNMMSSSSKMKFAIGDFSEVENITESICRWIKSYE